MTSASARRSSASASAAGSVSATASSIGSENALADGGGDLRDGLRGAEALEPAREESLERRGKRRRRAGRGQGRAGSVGAALGDGEGQLFREQRIASRPGGDESDGLLVHPGAEDGARDARRLVAR